MMNIADFSVSDVDESSPLDLSFSAINIPVQQPAIIPQPPSLMTARMPAHPKRKSSQNEGQAAKKFYGWSVPNIQELREAAKRADDKFSSIGAHLNYNAGVEGLKQAATHLKVHAGENYQAFMKAASSFDQAAVSAHALNEDRDVQEYLRKAMGAREVAKMARNLSILEAMVAEGFLRDADTMEKKCKLNELLRNQGKQ